jgi:lipopolysaccharide biosynthesis regulator YciM
MIGLASWYYYVPTVLGGNRKEAYRLVNKALAARPNYTKARMTKVEFLMEEKRYGEASRELKNVVETRHPDYFGDSVENKSLAKKLLKRLSRQNLSQNSLNQLN